MPRLRVAILTVIFVLSEVRLSQSATALQPQPHQIDSILQLLSVPQ